MQCPCGGSTSLKSLRDTQYFQCDACGRVSFCSPTSTEPDGPQDTEDFIVLTSDRIHAGGTAGCGFSTAQLLCLGVDSPAPKGWVRRLHGTYLQRERYERFLSLKGTRRGGRKDTIEWLQSLDIRTTPDADPKYSLKAKVSCERFTNGIRTPLKFRIRYVTSSAGGGT